MSNLHTERNLRLLNAYWFLRDFQLWVPVWIVFLIVDQGFSLTQVTVAESAFLVAVVLLEVPTGVVADRYGRSTSLALGALVLGLAVLLFAFTTSFAILLVSFLTWSLAATLMSGADTALLFDTLKAAGRTAEFERRAGRGLALSWLGVGLATLLAGPFASILDTRATIYAGALTCCVTATLAFLIREVRPEAPAGGHAPMLGSVRIAFREIWRQPEVRAIVIFAGATLMALESTNYLTQPYLLDRGIEVGPLFSGLQLPIFAAGLLGALLSPRLIRHAGLAKPMMVAPIAGAACCMALAIAPGLTAYLAFPMLAAINTCLQPLATGAINRRVSSERRATVLSLYGMGTSLGLAAMAPAVGYAVDTADLSAAFLLAGSVAAGVVILFGAPLFALRGRVDERSEPLVAVEL